VKSPSMLRQSAEPAGTSASDPAATSAPTWSEQAAAELDALRGMNRFRQSIPFDGGGPEGAVQGRRVISFASNDYLGLTSHPRVKAAAHAAIDEFGTGAMASRLVVGTRSLHFELEAALARWKSAERALVFPTGYAANLGVLATFGREDVTVFSDALNHASIIDGCRLAKAKTVVYRHGDLEQLAALMGRTSGKKMVVSETVFSMDGDRVDVAGLAELCVRHGALLVVDEAHDVFDSKLAAVNGLEVLRIGTLSKTLGTLGGFVAGPLPLIELLTNRARTFIFTTGLPPADVAAAIAALEICTGAEGAVLRARLRGFVDRFSPGHPSAILPIIIGEDAAALAVAARLFEEGVYVPAIRPPTVAAGTARLRVTFSAAHTEQMCARLQSALRKLGVSQG
jgi:8-amino-7-oxononanoate synthase